MQWTLIFFGLFSLTAFAQHDGMSLPILYSDIWSITNNGIKLLDSPELSKIDINLNKGNGHYHVNKPLINKILGQLEEPGPILQVSTDNDGNTTYMESYSTYGRHRFFQLDSQKKIIQYSTCTGKECIHVDEAICEEVDRVLDGDGAKIEQDLKKCQKITSRFSKFQTLLKTKKEKQDAVVNKKISNLKEISKRYSTNKKVNTLIDEDGIVPNLSKLFRISKHCEELKVRGLFPDRTQAATKRSIKPETGVSKQ